MPTRRWNSRRASRIRIRRQAVYYWAQLWIVTCQHCIQDTPVVAIWIDTIEGTRVYTIRASKWWTHLDADVAVTPFGLDSGTERVPDEAAAETFQPLVTTSVGKEGTATRKQIKRMGLEESTPVSMIGFPAGMIEGGRKNLPGCARRDRSLRCKANECNSAHQTIP